ncbi:MAG: hypothetical protein CVU22_03045 [Betaproteobacteria bacterium HGW-Betaproteobacteria-16]|nr:MAG: hypothetical protein CVU22_03045 [Betaproteobacteria bacterium HGW-Betaproteobacteria-16]
MKRVLFRRFIAASLVVAAPYGWAQHSLTVPFEVESVTNPGLAPSGEGRVTVFRLAPRYEIESVRDDVRTVLTMGVAIEQSSNTALSANRNLPDVGYVWESSRPTSVFGLSASYRRESTRSTEFADFGRLAVDSTQETGVFGARWSKDLAPNTRVMLGAAHTRVSYDDPLLEDYHETAASVAMERDRGEDDSYSLEASAARLVPDGESENDSRVGLLFRYERPLNEVLTLNTELGVVRTSGSRSQTDPVGRLQLTYAGERFSTSIGWARNVAAGGTVGGYLRTQEVDWTLDYVVTGSTSLSLRAGRAQSLAPESTSGSSISARLMSELTQFWSMSFGVEHRRLRAADGPASGNLIGLGFVYSHPNF